MENKNTQYVDFSNPNADKITTGVTNKPMINKKQTVVEWLIQNIVEDQTIKAKSMSEWVSIFEQAKEMEKEQIIDSYRDGRSDQQSDRPSKFYNRMAEQYYNETFKNK
jgi:hypothetical protein